MRVLVTVKQWVTFHKFLLTNIGTAVILVHCTINTAVATPLECCEFHMAPLCLAMFLCGKQKHNNSFLSKKTRIKLRI